MLSGYEFTARSAGDSNFNIFPYLYTVIRITQILSFALAIFTFAGSVGVVVYTHFCHDDGIEQSYILRQASLCEEEHEEIEACCATENHLQESDCCSDQVDFFQVDFENYETSQLFAFVPEKTFDVNSLDFDFVVASNEVSPLNYANPPPIRTAKQILIQYQVFRI
jgi:hypothetical protein